MPDLCADDFPAFFRAANGYSPFAWQCELARRVLGDDGWPGGIDVPTGLGKTAVLDIAVFALAAQADLPGDQRTAPTRTFMVVDRRLIVDQAHERAERLQAQLDSAIKGPVAAVAAALRRVSGNHGRPLEVVRMRGGVTWGWRWLASPDQPAIVVGTVDQFGSRLLFRGYGVGGSLRPIDAALTGTDALLVLDEAHIAWPLAKTASSVHEYESAAERPVLGRRHPRPVLLSATLPASIPDVYRPDPNGETSAVARRRLGATKATTLIDVLARGKDSVAPLARAMAEIALDRLSRSDTDRIAVVCNTIVVARAVFDRLRADEGQEHDTALLIGRCREIDRNRITSKWGARLQGGEDRPALDRPLVVVATQTIEVGADFDVDFLVSEAAPLDALLQRLGRLNRFGRPIRAGAVVVRTAARHDDDPVYGPATARTWEWLTSVAGVPAPVLPTAVVDAVRTGPSVELGTGAIHQILNANQRQVLAAQAPSAPEIIGPTLAAWARTSPRPEPDQPVAPFLHGLTKAAPEVVVCWRAGLPERHEPWASQAWEDELRTTPVASAECVSVPIWQARRLVDGRAPRDLSDLEGAGPESEDDDPFDEREPVTFCVLSDDGQPTLGHGRPLRPGDTVVLRAESGGHDEWGWTGRIGDFVVPDAADLCRRGRKALRLRAGLLAALMGGTDQDWGDKLRPLAGDADADALQAASDEILHGIERSGLEGASILAGAVRQLAAALSADRGTVLRINDHLSLAQAPLGRTQVEERAGDDDRGTSSTAFGPVALDRHLRDVGQRSAEVARRLGLAAEVVAAVELAGLGHDLGKADPRFQVMLHRGEPLRAEAAGQLLAKSGMDPADREAFRRAAKASGLPSGMRHETGSAAALARMIDAHPDLVSGADPELVLHLVASHHGKSRPVFPGVSDPRPVAVDVALPDHDARARYRSDEVLVDWEAPGRFERLGHRYGWWGLALMEAVVRLADIECSAQYGRDDRP